MPTSNARKGNPSNRVNPGNEIPNESTTHFDSKHIETVKVDLQPLRELCKQGEPRPKTTTIGMLPADYDPERYLHDARRIFYKSEHDVQFVTDDHFWFVTWFEQHASYEEREKYKQVYPFALSGIGLLKSEQQQCVKRLNLQLPKYAYRELTSKYYPYTLPLSHFQLIYWITKLEEESQKWSGNLMRRARAISLFWHSKRLAKPNKPSGIFATNYLIKHMSASQRTVLEDLQLFEQYGLIECVMHGGIVKGKHRSNRYHLRLPIQERIFNYPLVLISPGINSCTRFYRCDDLLPMLYNNKYELHFIIDTWHRREVSSRRYQEALREKKATTRKAWLYPTKTARADLDLKTERSSRAIQELNINGIDREYLTDLIGQLNDRMAHTFNEQERRWLNTELHMAREMLNHGLVHQFEYTRSGRTKATRKANPDRSGVYANHLNTSRTPGKQGYSAVWCAIGDSLADLIDIRSAEPLVAAICSGDEKLFLDYLVGDVYELAVKRLSLPEAFQERKSLKNKLWLPIQYGCTLNSALELIPLDGKLFSEAQDIISDTIEAYRALKHYLKTTYPIYWQTLDHLRNIGRKLAQMEFYPELPNGISLEFDRGKPHAVPPIVMQSYVSLITTAMFHAFWEEGYEPVFDIHDAVVTRKPVPKEFANQVVREVVLDLLRRHKRNWAVPEDVEFVTVEHLNIKPISLDEREEAEQLTEDYITELLNV